MQFLIYSDEPMVSARDVNYYPTTEDLNLIKKWVKFTISKALVDYLPPLKGNKQFLR